MPLTLAQTTSDLLSKLGIESIADADALVQQDVVVAINGAMQMLQTAGEEYFTQRNLTVILGAGTAAYTIADSIQSIIGPVRLNDQAPLKGMDSRGELDEFARIFLGAQDYGGALGTPMAYWPEFQRQGTSGDIVRITLHIAPTPYAGGFLVAEVIDDAPSYVVADLATSTVLPVAQNYTESIFLPIARMLVTRSSQFSRPELLAQLTSDAQVAMNRLGMAGGFPIAQQPTAERKTEA